MTDFKRERKKKIDYDRTGRRGKLGRLRSKEQDIVVAKIDIKGKRKEV